jgi:hypothetical protein
MIELYRPAADLNCDENGQNCSVSSSSGHGRTFAVSEAGLMKRQLTSFGFARRDEMFRSMKTTGLVAMALAAGVMVAQAQVRVTVVMKDGQQYTGSEFIYRMDRPQSAIRASRTDHPRFAADQIAYVDFGGTADVTDLGLSGSQHAVVLRDGTIHRGQVIELGHTTPDDERTDYIVSFRTADGQERRFNASQVARVYFGKPGAVATSGSSSSVVPGDGVEVQANQQWNPTGITVRAGEVVTFESTGEARLTSGDADIAKPSGTGTDRRVQNSALPQVPAGALIARVGNGSAFPIGGPTATVTMPASGQLFLGVNDDHFGDNTGGFRVKIQRTNRRR